MFTIGKYTIYVDKEFNGGLFDMDLNGEVSKVLKLFGTTPDGKDKLTFSRFPYSNKNKYSLATEEDFEIYGCEYFDENGNRPLKRKECNKCEKLESCFMCDEKFEQYKANSVEEEVYKCDEYYENGIPQ